MLSDGLYRVDSPRYRLCAGFVVEGGRVVACAPILRKKLSYWQTIAVRVDERSTMVVHCKRDKYDVYIGRPGPWGNPFRLSEDEPRGATIQRYREWLWQQIQAYTEEQMYELAALDGKTLGCWCAPHPCHGDVLAAAAAWAKRECDAHDRELQLQQQAEIRAETNIPQHLVW